MDGSRSHSEFFLFGKSSQNSPKPVLIFWSSIPCVFCLYSVYTLLKVVGYDGVSALGWVGGVSSIQVFLRIFGIF